MTRQAFLILLYSVASTLAYHARLPGRRENGTSCANQIASEALACLSFDAAKACSFCDYALVVPTKTRTVTEISVVRSTETSFSPIVTKLGTPPETTTTTNLTTVNSHMFANQTVVVSSGTFFVATTTAVVTDTRTAYTCGLPTTFSEVPALVTPAAPNPDPKRLSGPIRAEAAVTTPAVTFDLPQCYTSFILQHGQDGVTSARECYGVQGPGSTSTITSTTTAFSTSTATTTKPSTVTVTPTSTSTLFNTTTLLGTPPPLLTRQTPLYPNATSTLTTRTISTTSPHPTGVFHLYYTIPSLPDYPPQYARGVNTSDNSGTAITFSPLSTLADSFALDPHFRLVDRARTHAGEFAAKNPRDVYPWLFLDATTAENASDAPLCYTCQPRAFYCEYPGRGGGDGQVWAVCDGFLALGSPQTFVISRDCVVVELGYDLGVA